MPSRDTNHATVVRELVSGGATVVDLSRIGGGCPDLLVGYLDRNWLVEIKRDERPEHKPTVAYYSTRCGICNATFQAHAKGKAWVVSDFGCCEAERVKCPGFERVRRATPKPVIGRLSKRQENWSAAWSGADPMTVSTAAEFFRAALDARKEEVEMIRSIRKGKYDR